MRFLILAIVLLAFGGCASDKAWRVPSADTPSEYAKCDLSRTGKGPLIENIGDHATLTHIEFSERGNLFNRGCLQRVYDHIEQKIAESAGNGGVALVVFIHGWKHSANPTDSNLRGFKQILSGYAEGSQSPLAPTVRQDLPFQFKLEAQSAPKPRTVVGVYIGWRGAVFAEWMPDFLENISYWDRKSVAEEIGKGGVTEVLLSLGRLSRCGSPDLGQPCPRGDLGNVYLTIGHSFGAAIVVAAMNEVIMQRLIDATRISRTGSSCVTTRPLSDGVILLNPAIEANQLLQVKELIAENCFGDRQDILMHVLSSAGDTATQVAFPLGQGLGSVWSNHQQLPREDPQQRSTRELEERPLHTTTVGNYPGFWTGLLRHTDGDWNYTPLTDKRNPTDMDRYPIPHHLWAPSNSPVQMIYTDKNFIEDHNAIFNDRVLAYSATVVAESLALVRGLDHQVPQACFTPTMRGFDFRACFKYYLDALSP